MLVVLMIFFWFFWFGHFQQFMFVVLMIFFWFFWFGNIQPFMFVVVVLFRSSSIVHVRWCDHFGHVQIFRSYLFGHVKSVKWLFLSIYAKNGISYIRRVDLEGINSHLVIINVEAEADIRMTNLYRCVSPQDGSTARQHFQTQLDLIKRSWVPNIIILGD